MVVIETSPPPVESPINTVGGLVAAACALGGVPIESRGLQVFVAASRMEELVDSGTVVLQFPEED